MTETSEAKGTPKEQEFPDCAFCGPCRCDDECGCAGSVCWACGHWFDKPSGKVFVVKERESAPVVSTGDALKELREKVVKLKEDSGFYDAGVYNEKTTEAYMEACDDILAEIDAQTARAEEGTKA